jgi:hypothetical protein
LDPPECASPANQEQLMTTNIQFLHAMRDPSYLEQALTQGLMLTDHWVAFNPFENIGEAAVKMQEYSLGALANRAAALGVRHLNLNHLASALGSISGQIPMICFTEVQDGRDLLAHYMDFGAYGVVVSRSWLEANGGDRVLYMGQNSEVTRRLHRLMIDFQIAGMHVQAGQALLVNSSLFPILDLLAYVQERAQLAEVEWRIAGKHGFVGGKRATGDRIPLPLNAIEAVLVQKDSDVKRFEEVLKSLRGAPLATGIPPVLAQPATLPFVNLPFR